MTESLAMSCAYQVRMLDVGRRMVFRCALIFLCFNQESSSLS